MKNFWKIFLGIISGIGIATAAGLWACRKIFEIEKVIKRYPHVRCITTYEFGCNDESIIVDISEYEEKNLIYYIYQLPETKEDLLKDMIENNEDNIGNLFNLQCQVVQGDNEKIEDLLADILDKMTQPVYEDDVTIVQLKNGEWLKLE